MPSETTGDTSYPITGRCYCGARRFVGNRMPDGVTYCHCDDCKRVSGAPVAAFAAFGASDITFSPPLDSGVSITDGVTRWFCRSCGSSLAATYAYLPDQIYVSLGVIDQADALQPQHHAHAGNTLPWLHIHDDLPRDTESARDALKRRLK